MALDPSIILQGQAPNILGAISAGNDAAQNQLGYQRQREIENLYKTQGAGILAGDPNALNALAGYSPEAALGVQQNQLGMQQTQQQMAFSAEEMQMKRAEGKRLAEERMADKAATLTKEQAAQAAAQLDKAIQAGATAQTPEQWDAIVTQFGETDLVGQFAQKDAILAGAMGFKDWFDAFGPKDPPKPTASQQDYTFYATQEAQAGRTPLSFNDWDLQSRKASAANTNVSVGGDGGTKPGQVFDEIKASADAARSAAVGLNSLKEASTAIAGGVITGFAADSRLDAARLGAFFGVTDPTIIQNTETFRSTIAPQVAALMKATVGSTQISNADREFAEKAAGGSIALNEGTIKRLLTVMEKAGKAVIAEHKRKLDAVYPPGSGADRERALFDVGGDAPAATVPTFTDDAEYLKSLGLE